MSRPPRCRRITAAPKSRGFRPHGPALSSRGKIALGLDEVEALRLADLEGLHHEEAAARMRISRPTFSRIVEAARKKVAEALVRGRPLRMFGAGSPGGKGERIYCPGCRSAWRPCGLLKAASPCPHCRERRGRRNAHG